LHVPCRFSFLRIIRQTVVDLCAMAGMSEFKAAQLEMAVDEACANVIEHSYGGESAEEREKTHPGLRLNLIQFDSRVEIEIYDYGAGFNLQECEVIDPEKYVANKNERGLGMFIIHKFVDKLDYERGSQYGNCLRLTKQL